VQTGAMASEMLMTATSSTWRTHDLSVRHGIGEWGDGQPAIRERFEVVPHGDSNQIESARDGKEETRMGRTARGARGMVHRRSGAGVKADLSTEMPEKWFWRVLS
jgi:hypothetical protein